MPPHETLDKICEKGCEDSFCSFNDSQLPIKEELNAWALRVGADLLSACFACIALWGDSAPHTKFDSLYLFTFTLLSGVSRARYWIAAVNRRLLCRCGCGGRCTFHDIYTAIAWSCRALLAGKHPHSRPPRAHLSQGLVSATHREHALTPVSSSNRKLRRLGISQEGFRDGRLGWRGRVADVLLAVSR